MYTIFVMMSKENNISKDGRFPFDCPRHFDRMNKFIGDSNVLMGRLTFEELGDKIGGNKHVISRTPGLELDFPVLRNISELLSKKHPWNQDKGKETFIVGGVKIFNLFLEQVARIHITYAREAIFHEKGHTTEWFSLSRWMDHNYMNFKVTQQTVNEDGIERYTTYEKPQILGYCPTTDSWCGNGKKQQ